MQKLISGIKTGETRMLIALSAAMLQEVVERDYSRQDNEESPVTSTNKPMPKLPTLEEVQKEVQSIVWGGGFLGTSSNITEIVYKFICRKLSA